MARSARNALDWLVCPLEEPLSEPEALALEPLSRRHAECRPEAATESPRAHRRACRQLVDGDALVEIGAAPVEERTEALRILGDRSIDVLRLAARAEQRHHEPSRDRRSDVHAVVERDDVEAEVDPRGGSRRGHDAGA